jgi:hypothetical protein
MGLFYQRERLKKAELQLRRRYIQNQQQQNANANAENMNDGLEIEASSSFIEGHVNPDLGDIKNNSLSRKQGQGHGQGQTTPKSKVHVQFAPGSSNLDHYPRDNMSETETENGFGPDFLGPNYDPRTKVNRWMQQRLLEDFSDPGQGQMQGQGQRPFHQHPGHRLQRLSRVQENNTPPWSYEQPDENPYEMNGGPVYQALQGVTTVPQIIGLGQVPPGYLLTSGQPPGQGHPVQQPLQIHINSLQRGQGHRGHLDNLPPNLAVQDPPVQFIPQMPYQEPFRPPRLMMGSDSIPYADSRATTPSIISAPAGFSNSNPNSKFPSKFVIPRHNQNQNHHQNHELIELSNTTPSSDSPSEPPPQVNTGQGQSKCSKFPAIFAF